MATVLECVQELGLAHNNYILSILGKHVKQRYCWLNIKRKSQRENDEWIYVNDYPEEYKARMKSVIIHFISSKKSLYSQNLINDVHKRQTRKGL